MLSRLLNYPYGVKQSLVAVSSDAASSTPQSCRKIQRTAASLGLTPQIIVNWSTRVVTQDLAMSYQLASVPAYHFHTIACGTISSVNDHKRRLLLLRWKLFSERTRLMSFRNLFKSLSVRNVTLRYATVVIVSNSQTYEKNE